MLHFSPFGQTLVNLVLGLSISDTDFCDFKIVDSHAFKKYVMKYRAEQILIGNGNKSHKIGIS